jgi:nucleoside-diphosphate-sugar epimerase
MPRDLGTTALFGAGGAVGHALAEALQNQGIPYREVGRTQAVRADFLSGEGVREAARGVDTIFYLAGAPYTQFSKHPIMVRNALDAASSAGVKCFVHVAPVYSYGPPRSLPVPETQPHAPNTRKGRFRLEQEQTVLERDGGAMRTMVVHMPDFYGPHAELGYANVFMREALAGKSASWIGPLDALREFIFTGDMAQPLLALAADENAYGRCWNLGGVSIRAREFAETVFSVLRMRPNYHSTPKAALQIVGLFVPFVREVAEMYYLFSDCFVLDDSALHAEIGPFPKTRIHEGIEWTLDWMRSERHRAVIRR